jgi:hypothetical protein
MKNRFWIIFGVLLLVPVLILAGCATEPGYQAPKPEYQTEFGYPYVPPSYYDYNPQYEHWFTPPYWMPEIGPE